MMEDLRVLGLNDEDLRLIEELSDGMKRKLKRAMKAGDWRSVHYVLARAGVRDEVLRKVKEMVKDIDAVQALRELGFDIEEEEVEKIKKGLIEQGFGTKWLELAVVLKFLSEIKGLHIGVKRIAELFTTNEVTVRRIMRRFGIDSTMWLEGVSVINEEEREIVEKAKHLIRPSYVPAVLEYVRSGKAVRMSDLAEKYGVNYDGLRHAVRRLEEKGVI